jgi:hypothetical protein
MKESDYQTKLIKKLRRMFVGCVILKNDSAYIQGIPDLTILFNNRWAMLEVKTSLTASIQPNQTHWVDRLNEMSYCSFICPETESGVLHELQYALGTIW